MNDYTTTWSPSAWHGPTDACYIREAESRHPSPVALTPSPSFNALAFCDLDAIRAYYDRYAPKAKGKP